MIENQVNQNVIKIAKRICENTTKVHYGSVSATLKIHNGRVIEVTYSTTESSREQEKQK